MGNISSNALASSYTRSNTMVLSQRAASDDTLIHHTLYNGSLKQSVLNTRELTEIRTWKLNVKTTGHSYNSPTPHMSTSCGAA